MTDNKYNYGREIIFELRTCHAISAEVYMHWIEKIDKEEQLIIPIVSQRSELLPDFLYKDDFGIKIGYHGDTEVSDEWNDYLKKSGNCG